MAITKLFALPGNATIGGSRSGKTNVLLNLIKQHVDDNFSVIDKIYLYFKDSNEGKYQFLIKNCKSNGLENLEDPKTFIESSNNMRDDYKNIEKYKPYREEYKN